MIPLVFLLQHFVSKPGFSANLVKAYDECALCPAFSWLFFCTTPKAEFGRALDFVVSVFVFLSGLRVYVRMKRRRR